MKTAKQITLMLCLTLLLTTACVGVQQQAAPASDSGSGEPALKIGMITTLSGPGAALGVDVQDGFALAVDHLGGTLGGLPVELSVSDDQLNADVAKQAVEKALKQDKVDFLTGIIFSNVLLAVSDTVFEAETFYISPNAGPSALAGEGCNPFFFNVAWQNDNMHEAMGKYVMDQGYTNVYILAPNYPAGVDALTGFKRYYTGGLADEIYTQVNQLDFAAEMAQIRAAAPDAVYTFQPGGSGINFIKQYAEAGLLEEIPLFVPGFSADADVIKAVGEPMVGIYNTSHWALELENAANQKFVADFQQKYNRVPTLYASQGYDAALLIDAAVKAVNGDLSDKAAVRKALETATFDSVRGDFQFNTNHFPIQDYYLRQVIKNDQGEIVNQLVGEVFTDHADAYVEQCQMAE
ncbi:MAG: ABC transporter substrate-binding protein [Caldilineaceae bacterium]